MALTLPLSRQLQTIGLDLIGSQQLIQNVIDILNSYRTDAEETFQEMFKEATGKIPVMHNF